MKENINTNQKIEFNKARKNLQDTYINETTKYFQKQIDDIKTAADNKKSAIAWKLSTKLLVERQHIYLKLKQKMTKNVTKKETTFLSITRKKSDNN